MTQLITPVGQGAPYSYTGPIQILDGMGQSAEERPRKKVAIVGFAPSWGMAPFDDESWEIWGLNELYVFNIKRANRWFDIHTPEVSQNDTKRVGDHWAKLATLPCMVYMQDHYDEIPNSVKFPLDEMVALYGNYFTNTISYMMAQAIAEGYTDIALYGIDMAHDSEYGLQRPSVEYFVGVAIGKGIRVEIPQAADLMKVNYLYGYEEEKATAFDEKLKSREVELNAKLAQLDQQIAQLSTAREQFRGAVQDTQHIRKIWQSSHHQ